MRSVLQVVASILPAVQPQLAIVSLLKTYQHWFQDGMPAGDEANLVATLEETGQSHDRVVQLAESDSTNSAYEEATAAARSRGIFGSPSFVVDDHELFWGDDRLEDAIEYWHHSRA